MSSTHRRKVSTTLYLDPESLEALRELHARTRVPRSVYLREGLNLVRAKYAIEPPASGEPAQSPRVGTPRKMVSTSLYLDAEQMAWLQQLHARTQVPMAEYLREGVDLVLAKYAPTPTTPTE